MLFCNSFIYGRHFTLSTDNKELSHIFDRTAAIPALAAARLVRWSVMFCAYDYDTEFKSTKEHCNADMLSRLPIPTDSNPSQNPIKAMQIDFLLVIANQMQKATEEDRVLKKPHIGILHQSSDWKLSVDFDSSLVFPSFIAITASRPDIVIYSVLKKTVILIELTSPCEENLRAVNI